MSIWWSLHLRREAASVPLARRLLIGTMETAGVDPDISYDLSVALSEACANAVEHGGDTACGGPGSEAYRVTAYLDGEKCRIEVADAGPGFPAASAGRSRPPIRPAHSDAENGRGLCLIEQLADHVHIGNKPGRGGAVVSFDKVLKWRKDVAPLMAV
ncbi:ATP-binding protein [Streptomyces coeruleofuscus]|uniref:Histidine kinase/HSP90-like ATPase domain-containing protein n=1 Tax=Streptomyces coeruleofuscus TaxID=66879 RepID=A0ABP5V087_9ACTN